MIRVPSIADPEVAFGLSVLTDISRLIPLRSGGPVEPDGSAVVDLRVGERDASRSIDAVDLPSAEDGVVHVDAGLARRVARLVGLAAERASPVRDRHGRVPSGENALVRAGLEARPVIMEWAEALRAAARRAAARRPLWSLAPWPRGHRWAVALSHDVDVVTGWPALAALRGLELVRGGHRTLAVRVASAAARELAADPVRSIVRQILATEARHSARSTWFFLCGDPTPRSIARKDITYRIEGSRARRILDDVCAAGMEIGLHGSFDTVEDGALYGVQRKRLQASHSGPAPGIRQHFLRMRLDDSPRDMASAGFEYDSTLGFPDRPGFRLGVADVVPLWDTARGVPFGIDEVPFAWMDRSGSKYGGVEDPLEWIRGAMATASSVRAHDGVWVGIWHPYLADALGYPGAPQAFEELVAGLAAERPWLATLAEIVRWRRWRRGLRAESSRESVPRIVGQESGSVDLVGPVGEVRTVVVYAAA